MVDEAATLARAKAFIAEAIANAPLNVRRAVAKDLRESAQTPPVTAYGAWRDAARILREHLPGDTGEKCARLAMNLALHENSKPADAPGAGETIRPQTFEPDPWEGWRWPVISRNSRGGS
jgi:hypothetical protein